MDISQLVPRTTYRQRIVGLAFAQGTTQQVKLPKGMLTDHLTISGSYQIVITGTATSIRATGSPIKSIKVVADTGLVLKSWRPRDLVSRNQYFTSSPLAGQVTPPAATSGTVTGTFDLELPFGEPKATDFLRFKSSLPTWLYNELYLVIDWGDMNEVYVPGAATGVFTLVASGGGTGLSVAAYQWDKYNVGVNPVAFAQSQGVVYESYLETPQTAVANTDFIIELPRTEDIRAIMIQAEDANAEPTNAIINAITLEENNSVNRVQNLDGRTVRNNNAREFSLPVAANTGLYVLDFGTNEDIVSGLVKATSMTSLRLRLNVAAVAGVIRAHTIRPGTAKVA